MEQAISLLQTAFGQTLGPVLGAALAIGLLVLMVAMLAVPIWLLLQRRAGLGAEASAEIVRELDRADRVVTSVYEYLIYAAIAAMTGLAVFFYRIIQDDSSRDFLIFYGGVLYLLGMLWACGQLWSVRRRRNRERDPRSIFSALSQLGAKIDVQFQMSEPQVVQLDDAALGRAAQRIAAGGSLDEACTLVVPQYEAMNGVMKAVLRKAVGAALAARRTA